MKVFNRNFVLVSVSVLVLFYCLEYFFQSNYLASFREILFIRIFNEFELPSWVMFILGVVVLINLLQKVSSSLFRIRNYNFMYIALVFLLTSCEDLREGCVPYPSPEDWNEECELYFPYTANYKLRFITAEKSTSSIFDLPVGNVNVVCNVTRWQRLPNPIIPDTCYWSSYIIATLVGTTDSIGNLDLFFPIEFTSSADYFILEGYCEKQGYNRELFSRDRRYYFYRDEWIPCSAPQGTLPYDREIRAGQYMTQYSASP